METEKLNFDIIFDSLENYQKDAELNEAFKIYNDSKDIFDQTELFKSFQTNEIVFDSIGYTKA